MLREDLSDTLAHSRVVRFFEDQGRVREALAQAEQAVKAFPDDWRAEDDLLRCYERDGWTEEALALRERQFERGPNAERYQKVMKAAAAAGVNTDALRTKLHERMQRDELEQMARPAISRGLSRAPAGPDVTLRAEILGAERRWDEACALVQPPARAHTAVLRAIAVHLSVKQRDAAVALLLRVFEQVMPQSSSPYREALSLRRSEIS